MADRRSLAEVYSGEVEELLRAADVGRSPRSLDVLFDLAVSYGVMANDLVLDVGCANGGNGRRLLARTGCRMEGIEYLEHLVEMGQRENRAAGVEDRFRIRHGSVSALPFADDDFDFVFCRDMLTHVDDLQAAISECHRVLRPGRCMLVYTTVATDLLEARERRDLIEALGIVDESLDESTVEAALTMTFTLVEKIVLGSEGRQAMEEAGDHETTHSLLRIARLLTWSEEFTERHGARTYEVALADARWGVYQMLGKLQPTIYVLRK